MKRILWLGLALTLCTAVSRAQDVPRADVAVGYSYFRLGGSNGVNQNGGSGSIAFNANDWLGVVADFGAYHGSPAGVSLNTYSFLFGPRFSYHAPGRVVPFGQVLFGGAHITASFAGLSGSSTPFAWSLGGGADLPVFKSDKVAVRPQFEYVGLHENGGTTNCLRLSVGIVFRIGQK